MSTYIKNIINEDTPSNVKLLNENFDYLYLQANKPVYTMSGIQIRTDDNFLIDYINKPSEEYKVVRGPDSPYISKLSTLKRSIVIYHSILGESPAD